MPFYKRSIVEIDQNAKLSEIPDMGTWKPGALNTNPRCFGLLCTGKVQINSSDYKLKLNISAADKIPSFFTKNSAGEIVFAEPKPMCIIKMPRGHWGTIIVRLKSVSTKQSNAKNYVCLGVKEDGEIMDVLYGDGAYKYIDMTDESDVELVPLISTTMLSDKYTEAEVGTKVPFSSTNFDFGTVYRVTIDDEQKIEWSNVLTQTEGKKLTDISSGPWYNESNGMGVGSVKGKSIRMLAINNNTGKLASSIDGANWEGEGSVLSQGETMGGWQYGAVYGNGIWCVSTTSCVIKYSEDEARTWVTSSTPPKTSSSSLAFGNGVFMMVGRNRKVYASTDANIWEEVGDIPYSENDLIRTLCYSDKDDRWISVSPFLGQVYTSKDGRGTWTYIAPDEGKGLPSSRAYWFSGCYAYGNFYVLDTNTTNHCIMKSLDGKNWDLVLCIDSGYCINFYNGKLFAFHPNGASYYVGTFK